MKRKERLFLIIALPLLLLLLLAAQHITPGYSATYKANWGFSLPWTAFCSEIYAADSDASFHGDGIRYHIYSYKYEDDIDTLFTWAPERSTNAGASCADTAAAWLDTLDVPDALRPAFDTCACWYNSQPDGSGLIVFWNEDENKLYILERFL